MTYYINLDDAINVIEGIAFGRTDDNDYAICELMQIPAADVRENVRGKWLHTAAAPHRVYCSVCCETYLRNEKWAEELPIKLHPNYCPSCGSQMEEVKR